MNDRLEVLLLGPFEVRLAGVPVALPRGRSRAVLALLALGAGRTFSVDRLIDDLWGAAPPPTVATALHGLVSGLRKRLEPDRGGGDPPRLLLTRRPGYLLAVAPEQVDAHRFRMLVERAATVPTYERADLLREALSLWRGPPLEDVDLAGPDVAGVVALEELRLGALEERIDADLALGRHPGLIGEIEELVTEHPYRERLRGQLMLAHYRSGRQIDALNIWRQARTTLLERVGVEPGPGLRRLHQAILEQDPGLDLSAAGPHVTGAGEHARELAASAGELLASAGAKVYDRHYDAETAAELFSQANLLLPADHPQHDEVADRIPETYLMLGRHGDADAWLKRSLVESHHEPGNWRRELHLRLERARIQLIVGPDPIPMDELEPLAASALSKAGVHGSDDLASQACYVLGLIALRRGHVLRMEKLARQGVSAAERSGSPRERLASRWWLALALVEGPRPTEEAIIECEELVEMGSTPHVGVLTELARLHAIRGADTEAQGCVAQAERLLERRPGMLRPAMFVAMRAAEVDVMSDRWECAEPRLRTGLALADHLGEADQRAQLAARLARVIAIRGESGETAELAHLSRRTAPRESVTAQALWRVAMAAARSASMDTSAAHGLLEEASALVPVEMHLLHHSLRTELDRLPVSGPSHGCLGPAVGATGDHDHPRPWRE